MKIDEIETIERQKRMKILLDELDDNYLNKIRDVLNLSDNFKFGVDSTDNIYISNEQMEKLEIYALINYKYRVLYNECSAMLNINKCNEMYSYDILNAILYKDI